MSIIATSSEKSEDKNEHYVLRRFSCRRWYFNYNTIFTKNTSTPLHFYILTMHAEGYTAFNQQAFRLIKKLLKEKDPNNTAELIDCTELFKKEPPRANMETRFTPYAMLRLLRINYHKFLIVSYI